MSENDVKTGVTFDLSELNPGAWFKMENSDAEVCVRICAGDDYKVIRKQTVKEKVEYRQGQRFVFEETNQDLQNELTWDFCITDWKGFYNKEGNPIPCTKEMKILLMGKSIIFSSFVTKCLSKLAETVDELKEEELKN